MCQFEVFSMIVTRFRQGVVILPPTPPQNEPLKSPPRLGLMTFLRGCILISCYDYEAFLQNNNHDYYMLFHFFEFFICAVSMKTI